MAFTVYWILPLISGLAWWATLLALLLHWIVDTNRKHYPSMADQTTIAYISDVGAFSYKPGFIAGAIVTTIFLDVGIIADRWLRHKGRLVPNVSRGEKILKILSIVAAVVGTAGLILLTIFDTYRHRTLHYIFLLLFIAGYLFSAIFLCAEYQRLGKKHRDHRILRISFWVKLAFIFLEFGLAIAFGATAFGDHYDVGAILEWIVAFIFSLYVFSFVLDLWPAVHTAQRHRRYQKPPSHREMEEGTSHDSGSHTRRDTKETNGAPYPSNF